MEAVAWSAVGLLGATLAVLTGALLSITGRIQTLGDALRAEIQEQGRETRERLDAMSSRLDQHIGRDAG